MYYECVHTGHSRHKMCARGFKHEGIEAGGEEAHYKKMLKKRKRKNVTLKTKKSPTRVIVISIFYTFFIYCSLAKQLELPSKLLLLTMCACLQRKLKWAENNKNLLVSLFCCSSKSHLLLGYKSLWMSHRMCMYNIL